MSAQWFDLHTQATKLKLARERGQLLSISNSLVRLEPYQLDAVNWVMQKLRQRALIVDTPGISYNFRVAFEDGTGDVIREETVPVFVGAAQEDAQQALGERVVEGDSVAAKPDVDDLRTALDAQAELRAAADRYVSVRINEIKDRLREKRREETARELENLEEYARAERERIEFFIEEYERKADVGSDMDIAIRGQQERLEQLEGRIETRRGELKRREQVISLAPEVESYCLTLPL